MKKSEKITDRRSLLGIFLVIVGGLILLENVGIISTAINEYIFSWQSLLIAIGFLNLSHRKNNPFGYILIIIGVLFLIPKVFHVHLDFSGYFLPILLVGLGILILFKRHEHDQWKNCKDDFKQRMHEKHEQYFKERFKEPFCNHNQPNDFTNSIDYINDFNFFSGSEKVLHTKEFKGGRVTSIFGGSSYDLLNCELAEGENVLDVVHVLGGIKLLVPANWKIHMEVITIFGGYSDKRRSVNVNPENPTKVLRIRGIAVFGGGEIKNL